MRDPKVLVFAGSTRGGSLNSLLSAAMARELGLAGADVSRISLSDYQLPLYDGDLEAETGVPDNARKLHRLISQHQGVFIACPEYNGGYTPLLKNTIDWISRVKVEGEASVFKGRIFALGAASPGAFGGLRGLLGIRPVLEVALGAMVLPDQVVLPRAGQAFNDKGDLNDPALAKRLTSVAVRIVEEAVRYVPL